MFVQTRPRRRGNTSCLASYYHNFLPLVILRNCNGKLLFSTHYYRFFYNIRHTYCKIYISYVLKTWWVHFNVRQKIGIGFLSFNTCLIFYPSRPNLALSCIVTWFFCGRPSPYVQWTDFFNPRWIVVFNINMIPLHKVRVKPAVCIIH